MKPPHDRWTEQMMLHPDPDLEARLQELARRQQVPVDLAERVYRASVGLLPGRRVLPLPARLIAVRRVAVWGRLAMAASITLVAVAGLRLLVPGAMGPASSDREIALLEHAAARPSFLDDPRIVEVQQLLVTRDMTIGDLEGDFAHLANDLGM